MRPNIRLGLCAATITISALYGLLVIKSPETAAVFMLGYVGVLLTIIVVCHFGGRHD